MIHLVSYSSEISGLLISSTIDSVRSRRKQSIILIQKLGNLSIPDYFQLLVFWWFFVLLRMLSLHSCAIILLFSSSISLSTVHFYSAFYPFPWYSSKSFRSHSFLGGLLLETLTCQAPYKIFSHFLEISNFDGRTLTFTSNALFFVLWLGSLALLLLDLTNYLHNHTTVHNVV